MISTQEIKDAWARLMHPDGWQQADDGRVTFRSQIINGVKYIDFQGSVETVDWKMDFNIWPHNCYHSGYYKAFYILHRKKTSKSSVSRMNCDQPK